MNENGDIENMLAEAAKRANATNPVIKTPSPLMEKVVVPLALVGVGVVIGYIWASSKKRAV